MGRSTDEAAAPVIASMLHSEQFIASIGKRGATEFAETRYGTSFVTFLGALTAQSPRRRSVKI